MSVEVSGPHRYDRLRIGSQVGKKEYQADTYLQGIGKHTRLPDLPPGDNHQERGQLWLRLSG